MPRNSTFFAQGWIQSWTLGEGIIQNWTLRGHKCLHVKRFLTLLFTIGNIAALGGHGLPAPLDPPLCLHDVRQFLYIMTTFYCNISSTKFIKKQACDSNLAHLANYCFWLHSMKGVVTSWVWHGAPQEKATPLPCCYSDTPAFSFHFIFHFILCC